jgi:hypothetical protein
VLNKGLRFYLLAIKDRDSIKDWTGKRQVQISGELTGGIRQEAESTNGKLMQPGKQGWWFELWQDWWKV